ncbi:hypothetical protein KIPB_008773, partial [Kipferlia bialata]|eukprot:g8773.t1
MEIFRQMGPTLWQRKRVGLYSDEALSAWEQRLPGQLAVLMFLLTRGASATAAHYVNSAVGFPLVFVLQTDTQLQVASIQTPESVPLCALERYSWRYSCEYRDRMARILEEIDGENTDNNGVEEEISDVEDCNFLTDLAIPSDGIALDSHVYHLGMIVRPQDMLDMLRPHRYLDNHPVSCLQALSLEQHQRLATLLCGIPFYSAAFLGETRQYNYRRQRDVTPEVVLRRGFSAALKVAFRRAGGEYLGGSRERSSQMALLTLT